MKKQSVAEFVKQSRAKLGLTQEEFGKLIGYGQGTVAHLETGRTRNLHSLVRREIEKLVKDHAS